MLPLSKLLQTWRHERDFFVSPPFHGKKEFDACRKALTRAWIHADYNDQQRIIRVPFGLASEPGKSNNEKLTKLGILG